RAAGPPGARASSSDASLVRAEHLVRVPGVDVDVGHVAQVEDEAVVDERAADDGVTAGAHGDRQRRVAGEGQRRDDVVDGDAAGDEPRPPLDYRVEQGAGVLVGGV